MIFLHLLLVLMQIYFVESRVFCQDDNAMPWSALGYSCPVTCHVVRSILEKLRLDDTERIVRKEIKEKKLLQLNCTNDQESPNVLIPWMGYRQRGMQCNDYNNTLNNNNTYADEVMNNEIIDTKEETDSKDTKKSKDKVLFKSEDQTLSMYDLRSYEKILQNKKFVREYEIVVRTRTQEAAVCSKLVKRFRAIRSLFDAKCSRRATDRGESFLKSFTALLNKYGHSKYPFTVEMTGMLLDRLVGSGYLRDGPLNTKKLLELITNALARHVSHSRHSIVTVTSRNCVTLRAPGCYCQRGFAENGGQCVAPRDCITTAHYLTDYLSSLQVV